MEDLFRVWIHFSQTSKNLWKPWQTSKNFGKPPKTYIATSVNLRKPPQTYIGNFGKPCQTSGNLENTL